MIWCEHCRDHYPIDHYPNGEHGIGPKFGVTGMELQAVDIVRSLADQYAPVDHEDHDCIFCRSEERDEEEEIIHEPECPWLRAKEWVKTWDAL